MRDVDVNLISIVIPLYNKERAIEKGLLSVVCQTYKHWECVIVDDGSTDGSAEKVKPFLRDSRFVYIRKDNGGVSSARNLGVERARGEWVVFLDADDYLLPCALNSLLSSCLRYGTSCAVGCGSGEVKGEVRRGISFLPEGVIRNNFRAWALGLMSPRTGQAIFRREVLLRHPNRTDLSRYEDAESLCNILREVRIAYTRDTVFVYRSEFAQLSRQPVFERDFCKCLPFEGKSYWEKVLLGGILSDGINCYGREKMQSLYGEYLKYVRAARFYSRLRGYMNLPFRVLRKLGIRVTKPIKVNFDLCELQS